LLEKNARRANTIKAPAIGIFFRPAGVVPQMQQSANGATARNQAEKSSQYSFDSNAPTLTVSIGHGSCPRNIPPCHVFAIACAYFTVRNLVFCCRGNGARCA
jgi:hypothetical protein